jgi:octaprenyl-diphosphate synthase
LHPALSEFIQDEVRRRPALHLASIVLAAALPAYDTEQKRQQRIDLAAALELLTVALDIHKLLLAGTSERDSIDRALAGGTVLAGDYCFSRAASLAAQTENPQVVALFSDLLQQLSEGNLRRIFNDGESDFDEYTLLFRRGAETGATLAGLPAKTIANTAQFGADLAQKQIGQGHHVDGSIHRQIEEAGLAPFQRARWQKVTE